jgi:pimeloyl-ACP methyl ester carboxylesterase
MLDRRLLFVVLIASLSGAAPLPADTPAVPAGGSTIVIVHGAWGGSWAFRQVEALLTARGHKVYRVALTGLGERVHLATRDTGLSTHIQDVVNHLVFDDLKDVVLVGHSYGGMVVTGAADRAPERIRRLVYLDAFVPEDGESVMTLPERRDQRAAFIDPMIKDGFIVPPWLQPDQPLPHDVPQPLKTFTEPIVLKNEAARRLPATYILTVEKGKAAADDDFGPFAERAKRRGFAVEEMEADHNPQWSAPEALVERLDRAARR